MGSKRRKIDSCSRQILAHMSKPTAEFFNFRCFSSVQYLTKITPMGAYLKKGTYFSEIILEVGLIRGGLIRRRGLNRIITVYT